MLYQELRVSESVASHQREGTSSSKRLSKKVDVLHQEISAFCFCELMLVNILVHMENIFIYVEIQSLKVHYATFLQAVNK